jgi:two-component system sensor histidine kinase UhpB
MLGPMESTERSSAPRYMPLFLRVVAVNAVLLVVACVGTLLVVAPERFSLSSIAAKETGLVIVVLMAVAFLNVALLRRVFTPLERMAAVARRFDPRQTGQRVPIGPNESEVTDVARAFNDMLERLELERRATSRRVLDAQEGERVRVAQDLHDQVGQTLTAALLELAHVAGNVPAAARPELESAQAIVELGLEDIRRIARDLRPEALDDLGLPSALAALAERFARQARLEIEVDLDHELPQLSHEAELVIYRVAQEALTNVARHSGSTTAQLCLERSGPDRVSLIVADDGRGLSADAAAGGGMQGMAERASTVEAALTLGNRTGRPGAQIRLDVPIEPEGLWYR